MNDLVRSLTSQAEAVAQEMYDIAYNPSTTEDGRRRDKVRFEQASAKYDELRAQIKQLQDESRKSAEIDNAVSKLAANFGTGSVRAMPAEGEFVLPSYREYKELEQRALEQRTAIATTSGQPLGVATDQHVYDLLQKAVTLLNAKPRVVSLAQGVHTLNLPRISGATTPAFVAEGAAVSESEPSFDYDTVTTIKFGSLSKLSSEALEDSQIDIRGLVARQMVRDLAIQLDKEYYTGDGTTGHFTGLLNVSGVTSGASLGANGAAFTLDVISDTLLAAEQANVPLDRAVFFMSPRTWSDVRTLSTDSGLPLMVQNFSPTSDAPRRLYGIPVVVSAQIPDNATVGTSTDCSTIVLADMDSLVVAQSRAPELVYSLDRYFETDQIAARLTVRQNIAYPQPEAIVKTVGVRPAA